MAWQPFTPRGVAQFAATANTRLLLVQFFFALAAAAAVTWTFHAAWGGTLAQAVAALPERSEIRAGRLEWPDASPRLLAEGRCLSVSVDLEHSGALRGGAHVQVELGRTSARDYSLFELGISLSKGVLFFALNRRKLAVVGGWSPVIWRRCLLRLCRGCGDFLGESAFHWFTRSRLVAGLFADPRNEGFRGASAVSRGRPMPGAFCSRVGIGGTLGEFRSRERYWYVVDAALRPYWDTLSPAPGGFRGGGKGWENKPVTADAGRHGV